MTLALRYLYAALVALWRSRLDVLGESRVSMRVWPWDLDVNMHLNNGRFLSLMDLGRVDLIVRTGLLRMILRDRWFPVVGAATVRFRRPLNPFQRFDLTTRVVGWDEKWVYLEHRFECGGKVAALGYIQALFRSPAGNVPVEALLEAVGRSGEVSPPLPAAAEALRAS